MGNDTPLAVLSDRPQLLFSYFRQMFAQVTNPAIDPIREQLVMSLAMFLGPQGNLLDETAEHAQQIRVAQPVLTEQDIDALRARDRAGSARGDAAGALRRRDGVDALDVAVDELCRRATEAVVAGCGVLILSDREMDEEQAPIPSLLAISAVHHHLSREGLRWRVSLVAETGEAREVSHVALLIAYGASAVYPYLALETVAALARPEAASDKPHGAARTGALHQGGRQGSAQGHVEDGHLDAAELLRRADLGSGRTGSALVERHFTGTASRIGGIGMELIAEETLRRHGSAFEDEADVERLDAGGEYHYRAQGEHHNWNPMTIAKLQHATRGDSYTTFREFSKLANDETREQSTLRGLLDFRRARRRSRSTRSSPRARSRVGSAPARCRSDR